MLGAEPVADEIALAFPSSMVSDVIFELLQLGLTFSLKFGETLALEHHDNPQHPAQDVI